MIAYCIHHQELTDRGFALGAVTTPDKGARIAGITDPDGNVISLIENPSS